MIPKIKLIKCLTILLRMRGRLKHQVLRFKFGRCQIRNTFFQTLAYIELKTTVLWWFESFAKNVHPVSGAWIQTHHLLNHRLFL